MGSIPDAAGTWAWGKPGLLREGAMPTWKEGASPKGKASGARAGPQIAFGCSFWRELGLTEEHARTAASLVSPSPQRGSHQGLLQEEGQTVS